MTSSMGCMSSEGPSSPIFSEAYSRGSELSASIASSDGAGFFVAAASSELSQMFPTLDDLGTIDARFALDQFTVPTSFGSTNQSIGDTHSDITPMSACSDCWEFNTNDATRGSTANEMLTEEEDEDATLSTDTCFSGISDLSKPLSTAAIPLNNTTTVATDHDNSHSTASTSTGKEIVFDFKNIQNDIATKINVENVKKVDNHARNTRIQKQISLYEKDCTTEYRNLALDVNKFMETPSNLETGQCSTVPDPPAEIKLISADDLDKTITNVNQNLTAMSFLESAAYEKCPKTKSCVNLKTTPGAVVVRELFIEAPRMHATTTSGQQPGQYSQRMTLSQSSGFMGRHSITEMEPSASFPSIASAVGAKRLNTFYRQSSVSGTSSSRQRFTTTKVNESELKDSLPDDEPVEMNGESGSRQKNDNN